MALSPASSRPVNPLANVTSVFARTGAVVAASGDYTADLVTNAADKSTSSQQTFTGNVSTPALIAAGLTGATAASRYVGATASGAPVSGTFAVGDFIIDQSGKVYVCTTAGTPGTWTQVGGATGAAGGSLAGTYPNPRFTPGKAANYLQESILASCLAESMPHYLLGSNLALLSTQRLSLVSVPGLNGTVCTNVSWCSATTALSAPTNWWFALCDSSFNVIRQSTDQLSTAWNANTVTTLAMDSIPVTAGARVASTTVTLTIPTLSEALTTLVAAGDSITVANANIAAYNGTFTVDSVSSTTITYTAGSSATDSLAAPFPTVRLAAGKRVYTTPADSVLFAVIMVKGTVPTLAGYAPVAGSATSAIFLLSPIKVASGDTGLTGTCPSPIAHATGSTLVPWAAVS